MVAERSRASGVFCAPDFLKDLTRRSKPIKRKADNADRDQDEPTFIGDLATLSNADLGIISADTVEMQPTEWLWPYRLAAGEMALLAGDGGLGKSSILLAIAATITRGAESPTGASAHRLAT